MFASGVLAQSGNIVGNWRLINQSSCVGEAGDQVPENKSEIRRDTSEAPLAGHVVTFKDNATGEEPMRILNSAKAAGSKKFYYKFNGDMLLILDKRSQIISDSYMVDKFTTDSLIISNASRPCETMIFVKINDEQPN